MWLWLWLGCDGAEHGAIESDNREYDVWLCLIGIAIRSPVPVVDLDVVTGFYLTKRVPFFEGPLLSFLISLPKSEKSISPFSVFDSQFT